MKPKVCLFVFLGLVLIGCQQPVKTGELAIIDISKSFPKKEIHLQDIAEIEYVPLEMNKDVLLGSYSNLIYVSGQYIHIRDIMQGEIFVFNRNGTIATHFNHRGQGDKEYNNLSGVVFDEKNEEIFVFDTSSARRILVYTVDGTYKRTLKYDEGLSLKGYDIDDETLLVYDDYGLRQNTYREKPYMFMSKKDGSIVSELNINMPVRYSNSAVMSVEVNGQSMIAPLTITLTNNRDYGQDLVIADMSLDTIFRLTKAKELTPLVVRTPSVHASEPRTVWVSNLATEKFIIFAKATLDFELVRRTQSISTETFMHEFETGETSEVSFVNDDYPSGKNWEPAGVSIPTKNVAVSLIQASGLVEAYKEKKLKGELEKVTATLDEEDNPVLMIVKFK
jgi:hypothetical protein